MDTEDQVPGCSTDTIETRRARQREADRLRQQRKRAREKSLSAERRRIADAEAKRKRRLEENDAETARRRQSNAEAMRKRRLEETTVEKFLRNQADIEAKRKTRSSETPEQAAERKKSNAETTKKSREAESPVQSAVRKKVNADAMRTTRQAETPVQSAVRKKVNADAMRTTRQAETPVQSAVRKKVNADAMRTSRLAETPVQKAKRKESDSVMKKKLRSVRKEPTRNAADMDVEQIRLSEFVVKCIHCGAKHFAEERVKNTIHEDSFYDCCAHGRISFVDGEIVVDDTNVHPQTVAYPDSFKELFIGTYPEKNSFFDNIRKVNSSFALASLSANRYEFATKGAYCFKISGQVYYKFNQVAQPEENDVPTNGQLFFIDTEDALELRKEEMRDKHGNAERCFAIFAMIEDHLRQHNAYAKAYQMMKEEEEEQERLAKEKGETRPEVKLLFKHPGNDDGTRNLPRTSEVAAVFVTNANGDIPSAAIVVHERGKKKLTNLNPLDGNVEPMLYPLFYPNGGKGWYAEMKQNNGKKLSMDQYVKCKLAIRDDGNFVPMHYGRKLFQQWCVDQYARIEWERLGWVYRNQTTLKAANYKGLMDFLNTKSEQTGAQIGRQIILPSTHYGSPRNMSQHFQDAMRIVAEFGRPHLFITMTASTEDPDLKKLLEGTGQSASDRPDLVARIFDLKKKKLVEMVCEKGMFGKVIAYVYSIEFQKRGQPHIHMLCTLAKEDNPNTPEKVDKIIGAEIPDETEDSVYHDLVVRYMLHGPCKKDSVCMHKNGKCDKNFPKAFSEATTVNEDGKYLYRRRDDGRKVFVRGQWLDNRWVVPHNARLLKAFRAHVNVEKVADYKAVKYLFKYIFKGYDKAYTEMTSTDDNGTKVIKYDECAHFLEQRYISPVEACWRIMGKELQGKSHSVEHLPVHLKGEKVVVFDPKKNASAQNAAEKDDKLEAFFRYCLNHPGETIKYPDMPKHHTWHDKEREWRMRKAGFNTLGRVYSVSPSQTECFHLRILLHNVESPTCFEDLRTVNGVVYETYAKACLERGLIRDDQEWENCLEEAALFKFPRQLRLLFVTILTQCSPAEPEKLWDKFKDSLSEDFQRSHTKDDSYRLAYISLNRLLLEQGKTLADYSSMPACDDDGSEDIEDIISREEATKAANDAEKKMNGKQKKVYRGIKKLLEGGPGRKCQYLNGAAGTGKSFVFRAIYHLAVGMSKKVTTMAFMGIAATVLPKGKTVHNVFGLPFRLSPDSQSTIELGTKRAEDLKNTDIFLWDEAPSAPRYALEIADRKLREVMNNNNPFGGKIVLLTGDFCQTLAIKEGGTRGEIVDLAICSSKLWKNFEVHRLSKNMRAGPGEKEFAIRLRKIGTGQLNDEDDMVKLPSCTITDKSLASKVFAKRFRTKDWNTVANRAILAMLNTQVDELNEELLVLLEGGAKEYTSIDTAEESNTELAPEVLNTFNTSGLPHHTLKLKTNCSAILMRNLNVQRGLCNGTRMRLIELGNHVLKCSILTGDKAGDEVYIPRITLKEEEKFPVAFRRHQFPVKLAFAMTVNRSQGQTLDMVGLDLSHAAFAAGQLYVGLSRVRSWDRIKVRLPEQAKATYRTKNIVYKEVLAKAKVVDEENDNYQEESED